MPYKDKDKRREYGREYRRKYRTEHPEYVEKGRARIRRLMRKRNANAPWLTHYDSAKTRCNNPKCREYERYGGRGIKFLLTREEIELLYKRDKAQKMNRPSIDRIDNDGDYCFENCRFIEHSANRKKQQQSVITTKEIRAILKDIKDGCVDEVYLVAMFRDCGLEVINE